MSYYLLLISIILSAAFFDEMLAELAAFSRGGSPVVSSAQYRSYIMPKIFGETATCESTATDASQMVQLLESN